jgi:hypothetical protein
VTAERRAVALARKNRNSLNGLSTFCSDNWWMPCYGRALTITRVRSSDWTSALNCCTLAKTMQTISSAGSYWRVCNS